MKNTLTPPEFKINLRKTEATILMMVFDAGLINLNNYTMTSELVFGMKKQDENHKKLMEELFKLQSYLHKTIYGNAHPVTDTTTQSPLLVK